MEEDRRVLVMVHAYIHYSREILLGMFRYANLRAHWDLQCENIHSVENVGRAIRQWKAHGVFAEISNRRDWQMIVESGVPVVNVSGCFMDGIANVCPDNEAVGRMAVGHLLQRGLRTLAYCGEPSDLYSLDRERGFVHAAAAADCQVLTFYLSTLSQGGNWRHSHARLVSWLRKLPKPVGVMACSDFIARYVMWACRHGGVRVPDEVALIGVDDDPLECGLCGVPLSSVRLPAQAIGEQAAARLDRMMHGRCRRNITQRVPPVDVVARYSSDVYATADPVLVSILRHMRANLSTPMPMGDLARRFGLSRRSMELRFRHEFGLAPGAELLRARLDRAKTLLAQTNMKITTLHAQCGFSHHSYFCHAFRRKVGMSPMSYRRQFQVHGDAAAMDAPTHIDTREAR